MAARGTGRPNQDEDEATVLERRLNDLEVGCVERLEPANEYA